MDWIYYLCLIALGLLGLCITIMTLPGLWLMLAAAAGYAMLTHWQFIGPRTLLVLFVLALVAEVLETLSAGRAARRAGGSRRGMWGALIGAIAGGLFLTIPLLFVGTLIGVCIGTFIGAMIGELTGGRDVGESAWIGASAAHGRLIGTLIKLAIGCAMFAILLWTACPRHLAKSTSPSHAVLLFPLRGIPLHGDGGADRQLRLIHL